MENWLSQPAFKDTSSLFRTCRPLTQNRDTWKTACGCWHSRGITYFMQQGSHCLNYINIHSAQPQLLHVWKQTSQNPNKVNESSPFRCWHGQTSNKHIWFLKHMEEILYFSTWIRLAMVCSILASSHASSYWNTAISTSVNTVYHTPQTSQIHNGCN